MNKLSIVTAITLASIAFVSAEENNEQRPLKNLPAVNKIIKQEDRDNSIPNLRTGDPVIDAQLKALNDEMQAKIKVIRDEYAARLKVILSSRATTTRATSTPRYLREDMPGRREGMDEGRKIGIPFMMNASTTATGTLPRPQMMRVENDIEQNQPNVPVSKIMNFFRGFFGGDR